MSRLLPALLAAAVTAVSLPPAVAAPAAEPLYVAIVWHQHQPQYPKAPGTDVYEQPWVRLHGAKDYYDMAAMVRQFPGLKLTINLTPVLLEQIEDYNRGATDRHALLAARPAEKLSVVERHEAYLRFFQATPSMIGQFPRYKELKAKPEHDYTPQDWRDLATLFHLAWTDPSLRASGPLAAIARKGRNFTEAEKLTVLAEQRRILTRIIPLHRELQNEGRIEVTTTPYYHPILPLIADSRLALEAMPESPMPTLRMHHPEDARYHVRSAVAYYRKLFGRSPRGMWPGEGSVAQAVAPFFKEAGIRWIATDEGVLARSLKTTLRDGDRLARPDLLYKPYQVTDGPAIVFRDRLLSDDIGFRYARMDGRAAGEDLLGKLRAIARAPHQGSRLVSIILDGENAWENYTDDGKAFLSTLYGGLTHDPLLASTTPSEYLASHPARPLAHLWAGSWIGASFATWIGEDEENRAWDLLVRARDAVEAYGKRYGHGSRGYRKGMAAIYPAEGSDWFWWYGADQDSGHDEDFDAAYRRLLSEAYRGIHQTPPAELAVAIIQSGVKPDREPRGYLHPRIDGTMARLEWADAGSIFAQGGAMNLGDQPVGAMFYGWDKENLYLAVQFNGNTRPFTVQLGFPGHPGGAERAGAGFFVHDELTVDPAHNRATLTRPGSKRPLVSGVQAAGGHGMAELALPWRSLAARSGDPMLVSLVLGRERFPQAPLKLQVPLLAVNPIVSLADASDPGIGPGNYTLPGSGAYTREAVDLKSLTVSERGDDWLFTWKLGEVRNPWSSPIGLSLVTLDLYLAPLGGTIQGESEALAPLLLGRDAYATRPWSQAISIEGWQQGLYKPDGQKIADLRAVVDPYAQEVRAWVPKALLSGNPRQWAYLATLAGQDGFAQGRVRKVLARADADHFGGANEPGDTPLLDTLLPSELPQEQALTPAAGHVVLPYLTPEGKVEGTE